MNILLSSVGRRPYLVNWFKEALEKARLTGSVIAIDSDVYSPSRAFADLFIEAPRADDEAYVSWLSQLLSDFKIDLAISINDFELSEWSRLPFTEEWNSLVRLTPLVQEVAEDKHAMHKALNLAGVNNPFTWIGSQLPQRLNLDSQYIVKGRFGSASRGLRFSNGEKLLDDIQSSLTEVTTRQGTLAAEQTEIDPLDLIVVQNEIQGQEFGLDVVCDLSGNYEGVLARKKLAMRAGETDRAVTVNPEPFAEVAEAVSRAVPHPGTIDVDVIIDEKGAPFVIDVNPRFGGGYPFSHLAGADLPSAYVGWKNGITDVSAWLKPQPGVISGKYVEAVRVL